MAANTPSSAAATRPSPTLADPDMQLSAEDAELFASRIRPSWELVDEVAREDLLAEMAAPAGSKPVGDTIIDGVPTFAVGDAPAEPVAFDASARNSFAKAVTEPESVKPPPPKNPPPRAARTQMGMGASPSAANAHSAGEAPAAPAPSSRRAGAPVAAAGAPVDDDIIEIPGTGAPKGLFLKLGIAAAVAVGLGVVGLVAFGGKKPDAPTTPTAAAVTTQAPTTQAQTPTTPPVAPPASAAATAPTTAPTPSAQPVDPKPEPKVEPPKPEPKVEPPKPEPKKAATPAPEPKKAATPPPAKPPAKKGGGGIIRETPF